MALNGLRQCRRWRPIPVFRASGSIWRANSIAVIAAIRRRFKSLCFGPFSGKKDRKWAKKLKKLTRSKLDFD